MGTFDSRIPWLPTDALLEDCINEKETYPSPYPDDIEPSISIGISNSIISENDLIDHETHVIHSLEKTSYVASKSISIHLGSVVVGEEISLNAPVVKLYDDNQNWPIRTTLIAKKKFCIEAQELIIDGADILPPREYSFTLETVSLKNITLNTKWLGDLVMKLSQEQKDS